MNGLGQAVLKGALGGLAGAAIMTAGEKLEQRLTGRPSSNVPGRTIAHVLRLPRAREDRFGRNMAMHYTTGLMLGAVRGVMSAANLRGPYASLLHAPIRLTTAQVLDATEMTAAKSFLGNKAVDKLANPTALDILVSSAAALAGVTMVASRRFALLAGPLIALALIPSAAMAGIAAAVGEGELLVQALERLGIDVALVFVLGLTMAGLKQLMVHRRRPLP